MDSPDSLLPYATQYSKPAGWSTFPCLFGTPLRRGHAPRSRTKNVPPWSPLPGTRHIFCHAERAFFSPPLKVPQRQGKGYQTPGVCWIKFLLKDVWLLCLVRFHFHESGVHSWTTIPVLVYKWLRKRPFYISLIFYVCVPVLRRHGEEEDDEPKRAEDGADDPEPHGDLGFGPAERFKVVMDGRGAEHFFAVPELL